jgi:hypothetical protein
MCPAQKPVAVGFEDHHLDLVVPVGLVKTIVDFPNQA